jgi:hypothetical protein
LPGGEGGTLIEARVANRVAVRISFDLPVSV